MRNVKQIALAAMIVAAMGMASKAMAAAGAPTFTSVSPDDWVANALAGNTETVEIVGTNFFNGGATSAITSITFGGVAGTAITALSDTLVSVKPPVHAKGAVDIVITTAGGTVTGVKAFAYTTANRSLQVTVNMTLGKNASIAWNAGATLNGTNNDDTITNPYGSAVTHPAGDIAPYVWFVRDSEFGAVGTNAQVDLSAVYSTDGQGNINTGFTADNDNVHNLNVLIKSKTNSIVEIDGLASDCVPSAGTVFWANTGAAGNDTFQMQANLQPNTGGDTNATITNSVKTAGVVTITTSAAHNFIVGDFVSVSMFPADANYDGGYLITAVPSTTTFSYALAGNVASAPEVGVASLYAGGTVTSATGTLGVATITTSAPHGLLVGNTFILQLVPANPAFDGYYTVASVPTATTFTYAKAGVPAGGAATGKATITLGSNGTQTLGNTDAGAIKLFSGGTNTTGIGTMLNLAVSTPTSTASAAGVQQTTTVTLIAFAP